MFILLGKYFAQFAGISVALTYCVSLYRSRSLCIDSSSIAPQRGVAAQSKCHHLNPESGIQNPDPESGYT